MFLSSPLAAIQINEGHYNAAQQKLDDVTLCVCALRSRQFIVL
jgi:hypothetical protein